MIVQFWLNVFKGLPYPDQLTAAADAVMQYAFHLGFKQEDIVLFSWSIGGFACSWLANQYPDTKSVVKFIYKAFFLTSKILNF